MGKGRKFTFYNNWEGVAEISGKIGRYYGNLNLGILNLKLNL